MCWGYMLSAEAGAALHWGTSPWAGMGWAVSPCLAGWWSGKRRTVPMVASAPSGLQAEGKEGPIKNGRNLDMGGSRGEEAVMGQRVLGTQKHGTVRDGRGAARALLSGDTLDPRDHRAQSLTGPLPVCPLRPLGAAGSPCPCSREEGHHVGAVLCNCLPACPWP